MSYGLEYVTPVLLTMILVSLENIQEHLENPFDQVGEDDITFNVDKFMERLNHKSSDDFWEEGDSLRSPGVPYFKREAKRLGPILTHIDVKFHRSPLYSLEVFYNKTIFAFLLFKINPNNNEKLTSRFTFV